MGPKVTGPIRDANMHLRKQAHAPGCRTAISSRVLMSAFDPKLTKGCAGPQPRSAGNSQVNYLLTIASYGASGRIQRREWIT